MITIQRILCPVDFSEFSRRALDHALAMAKWYDARLTVLYVFANLPSIELPPIELDEQERQAVTARMKQLAAHVPPGVAIEYVIRGAPDVRRAILEQAAALDADLLVVGSHGRRGFEKLLLGSVTEYVIRNATCPVVVVPCHAADAAPDAPVHFHRILCPVDFSPGSMRALKYALSIAQETDARLTVMHAIEVPPELLEHQIPPDFNVDAVRAAAEADRLRQLRDLVPESARMYCTVETVVQEGAAYRQILRVAAEQRSDLIVMGVQGRGAIDVIVFGSNTYRVIRAAACPVLTVR